MRKSVKYYVLVTVLMLLSGVYVSQSYAVQYTTRDPGATQNQQSRDGDKGKNSGKEKKTISCTEEHKRAIQSFENKAIKKKEEFEALLLEKESIVSAQDARKFTRKLEKLQRFYKSDEFKLMEQIYALCDEDLPRPKEKVPFFFPESMGFGDEVNAI